MAENKVVGIDPGLAGTGIGIVTGSFFNVSQYSFGSIDTDPAWSLPDRLAVIYQKVNDLIGSESPDLVVLEDIFILNKYPKSAIILGKVSGVIALAASQNNVPVIDIAVREAKKVLTGSGADKSPTRVVAPTRMNCFKGNR